MGGSNPLSSPLEGPVATASHCAVVLFNVERSLTPPGALEPLQWDYFLSHGQAGAGDQVNTCSKTAAPQRKGRLFVCSEAAPFLSSQVNRIAFLLEERGKTVWYDMNMVRDPRHMDCPPTRWP